MPDLKETPLHALDQLLAGTYATEVSVVTKKAALSSARQHNECIRTIRDGCDILATNFDVITRQQKHVMYRVD